MRYWLSGLLRWLVIWIVLFLILCAVSVLIYWKEFWQVLRDGFAGSLNSVVTLLITCIGVLILFSGFFRMFRR